ncbi:MAG: hypothetical protein IKC10_02920 [Alphaproteobacteria bacterium]|nr:hypothetical protein [Alphaproteobacteria bacterium]
MKEDFYTFGGGHFWEDVFFYQKWRIQRNYITKSCRLLDNWDIKRHEGSFEECRLAFVKYIDAYEIARPKGHMIIMIHSIGQSKNVFKPMWRRALKDDCVVAALNYPSTQKSLESHTKQFHFFLEHMEDVDSVSFVTLGAGNTIVQELFKEKASWQSNLKFRRCVFVNPYVSGSKLLTKLCKNKLLNFIIGPMGNDLSEENIEKLLPLTAMESGVIISNKSLWLRLAELLTFSNVKNKTNEEIKIFTGAKDVVEISNFHRNIFDNKNISDAVMSFLLKGEF